MAKNQPRDTSPFGFGAGAPRTLVRRFYVDLQMARNTWSKGKGAEQKHKRPGTRFGFILFAFRVTAKSLWLLYRLPWGFVLAPAITGGENATGSEFHRRFPQDALVPYIQPFG